MIRGLSKIALLSNYFLNKFMLRPEIVKENIEIREYL